MPDASIPRVIPAAISARAYRTCASLTEVLGILAVARPRQPSG
ncbi:MAG: hypothetical protein ACLQDY_25745 [Streptosporangiaceae bacterium]